LTSRLVTPTWAFNGGYQAIKRLYQTSIEYDRLIKAFFDKRLVGLKGGIRTWSVPLSWLNQRYWFGVYRSIQLCGCSGKGQSAEAIIKASWRFWGRRGPCRARAFRSVLNSEAYPSNIQTQKCC